MKELGQMRINWNNLNFGGCAVLSRRFSLCALNCRNYGWLMAIHVHVLSDIEYTDYFPIYNKHLKKYLQYKLKQDSGKSFEGY